MNGSEVNEFINALNLAFPSYGTLALMVQTRLNWALPVIAAPEGMQMVAFNLINHAIAHGDEMKLLAAAREAAPRNPWLLAFASRFDLASSRQVEAMIVPGNGFLDVARWRTRMGEVETRVGCVELCGKALGTAFLIGPCTVMTNYHVTESLFKHEHPTADFAIRFDYKRSTDGSVVLAGRAFALAADWNVAFSPYSAHDDASIEELDYSVVRLAEPVGNLPVGANPEPTASPRGWESLDDLASPPAVEGAILIMQHPLGEPLKLAMDLKSVIAQNTNRTSIQHRTNTEPGSSGSPSFDRDWRLVALHRGSRTSPMLSNEGVPMLTIRAHLARHGTLAGVMQC